jgi:hypothetical protein
MGVVGLIEAFVLTQADHAQVKELM